eukprot:scaffold139_cov199-Alexandrium_tamarense.AAC.27
MNEPRDAPARRQQFTVICLIMALYSAHCALNAGLLSPVTIVTNDDTATFPGGEFVYKLMTKDYAASSGTLRTIKEDLGMEDNGGNIREETVDVLYTVLLDDAAVVPGGLTRFASGVLVTNSDQKRRLMDVNVGIAESGGSHSKEVRYEVGSLPKVAAAVAQHPYTDGAFSAILQTYKIIPAFQKYAKEHGVSEESPIIISTCSINQSMCTFYMPLTKRNKFFLGKQTAEEYAQTFHSVGFFEKMGIDFTEFSNVKVGGINFSNVLTGAKRALGMGAANTAGKSEL